MRGYVVRWQVAWYIQVYFTHRHVKTKETKNQFNWAKFLLWLTNSISSFFFYLVYYCSKSLLKLKMYTFVVGTIEKASTISHKFR
jgi:hypothetical protein